MRLELLTGDHVVCRLGPDHPLPEWAAAGPSPGTVTAIVRTAEELSLISAAGLAPEGAQASGPWRALRVAGTLDHALTGILATLAAPLADAGVPIFAVSTFDTDYVLVPAERLGDAVTALAAAGHELEGAG